MGQADSRVGKTDTHCYTARRPNGEKVGQMDIIPEEGSNIVGQMEKTMNSYTCTVPLGISGPLIRKLLLIGVE